MLEKHLWKIIQNIIRTNSERSRYLTCFFVEITGDSQYLHSSADRFSVSLHEVLVAEKIEQANVFQSTTGRVLALLHHMNQVHAERPAVNATANCILL